MPIDYKKTEKRFYLPKTTPEIIDVPEMVFLMIVGKGDPNTSAEYASAMEILYGLSYSIKMSKMGGNQPSGYFDYVRRAAAGRALEPGRRRSVHRRGRGHPG